MGVWQNEAVRLNHVTVGSTDLDRSERFFRLLGFRAIVKTEHYRRFECPEGDGTFSIKRVDFVSDSEQVTIYFETDDPDSECERLRGLGVVFEQSPADMPWLWREARLRDPDGHRLCIFHAGRNRLDPPWRIGRD